MNRLAVGMLALAILAVPCAYDFPSSEPSALASFAAVFGFGG
jgi:hypothetical protein